MADDSNRHAARAFWVDAPGHGSIRDEALPAPAPGAARVRTLYTGVSRGTESLVWAGRVPDSEASRMRCPHQAGEFSFPVKYGYANVGRVLEGPRELLGSTVFCLFPHQTEYVVESSALISVPAGVPAGRAILAANLETALNALWDAELRIGDRVSIVGAGVVGSLCAYLAKKICAVDVELVDVRNERAEVAAAFGARFATPQTASRERDVVFHASATGRGLETALEIAAAESTVVELSWFGDAATELKLGGRFHSARLTLRASQVGTLSPKARARFDFRARLALALALCDDAALDVLIDGENAFEDLPALMPSLGAADSGVLCRRIRY